MSPKSKKKKDPVVLIEDPYGFSTLSVAHAQELEEVAIDQDLIEEEKATAQTMENLAKRVADTVKAQTEEHEEAMARLVQTEGLENSKRLAAEIEEDEALKQAEEAESTETPSEAEQIEAQDAVAQMDDLELQSCIETLLFLADGPVKFSRLIEMLGAGVSKKQVTAAIAGLQARYSERHHGIELCQIAGGYQFRTKLERAEIARKLARVQTHRLSTGAMETLAIVAYKQPVMKEDIDQVRGVDSSHFIRTLLEKGLIEMTGRSELPGRPIVYATTELFLQVFGLANLQAMPPLRELEQMMPASSAKADEDPRVQQMRKLVGEMKSSQESLLYYDPKEDEKILKDIKDRVQSISTTTATLMAEDAPPPPTPTDSAEVVQAAPSDLAAPQAEEFAPAPVEDPSTESAATPSTE